MEKTQNDDDDRLARHINRIVTAPYAVSLKDLHDLVQEVHKKNVHPCLVTLRRWAEAKPCQVDALAAAILDGVRQWPYTLTILGLFASSSSAFRDAVLRLQPTLLDDSLKKAVDGDEKLFETCISLLSHPLPEETLVPASLPSFVLKTIERMVQNSCADTARSLYWLMSGIHGTILEILPEETLVSFLTECKKTLRNLDDHMGNLLCLATLANVAYPYTNGVEAISSENGKKEVTSPDTTSDGQEPNQEPTQKQEDKKVGEEQAPWLRSILQFFGPKHGMKTLDLVVVRVILACSASSTLSVSDSIHGIQLAKEICAAVEPEQRDVWIRSNGTKLVKLCQKLLREGIDSKVQIMGMVFLVSLLEVDMIPKEIVALAQRTLISSSGRQDLDALSGDFAQLVVKKISPRFDQETLQCLLEIVASALSDQTNMDVPSFLDANISSSIAAGLLSAMQMSQPVKSSIASVLATAPRQRLYTQAMTFQSRDTADNCINSYTCPSALLDARNKLYIDLSALFLGAHILPPPDQPPLTVAPPWTFLSAFVEDMKEKQARFNYCPSSPSRNPQRFDFFTSFSRTQNTSPPLPSHTSHSLLHQQPPESNLDWKAGLAQDLLKNAQQSHQAVIQRVSAVCRDLEDRCENVETPLRDLTSKLDKMTTDCKSARTKNVELESELKESSRIITALKDDKFRLEQHSQKSKTRAEDLSTRLRSAQKDLEDLKHRSKKDHATAKEKARDMELEHLAILSARDDTIDEVHGQLAEVNSQLETLRERLAAAVKEKSEVQQDVESLEHKLAEARQSVDAKSALNTEHQEEIARLRADKEYMRAVTDRLQSKVDETVQELKALNDEIQQKEEDRRNELEVLKQEQDREHSKLTAEVNNQNKMRKEEIRKLQDTLHSTESKAIQKVHARDKRIESLEQKVALLRQERETKAREFAEAQELSTRLMALMDRRSFDQNESQPPDTAKYSSGPPGERVNASTTEEDGDTEQEQFKTQVSYQGSFNSFASSNSTNSGPTPKRPKSSRGSKKSSGVKDDSGTGDGRQHKASPSTTRASDNRQPLEETGLNQSPTKATSKSGSTQSSSILPGDSQDSKLGSQFDIFDSNDDSDDYGDVDLDGLEYLDDGRFTSTPSV